MVTTAYHYDCFVFNDTATTEIYTLSLHDALPILNHAGNAATKDVTGCDVVSASALEMEVMGRKRELSKEFTKEDLKKLVENFVNAGIRAKKAGYDGVEIHSAHFYLLNQFYSPLSNKRTDKYGGNDRKSTRL